MKRITAGIVAHVDAGKTTLSEALLYGSGAIRKLGRVDDGNSCLDTDDIERARGITIYSKQARLPLVPFVSGGNEELLLIDTPGHVDFSAEMERTLCALDVAVLLINASDGIQAHTRTLWKLLEKRGIPVIIFVNKMDMPDTDKESLLTKLQTGLSSSVVDFSSLPEEAGTVPLEKSDDMPLCSDALEAVAATDESLVERFLESGAISCSDTAYAVQARKVFPCIFGSALRLEGTGRLMNLISSFVEPSAVSDSFGAMVYKVSRDRQGTRLTHLKVTGGVLKVRDMLGDEKINEIRLYTGEKYESVKELPAGDVCVVTGLKSTRAGMVFGSCPDQSPAVMEPALSYSVILPEGKDVASMLPLFREIEEESPELKVCYNRESAEITMMLMGEIQTEVIVQLMKERYGITVAFGEGKVAYRETVEEPVEGTGHYEPLRHYAEVHVRLVPLERGAGLRYSCNLSVDVLDTNWQRLILTHLQEKEHIGILTGSPLADVEYQVTAGRAHLKHTEGGDFRQSTYRAVRHALMHSKSILLEPWYSYEIVVPETCTGRVMADMDRKSGTCCLEESRGGFSVLCGEVPVACMMNYMNELRMFTKGQGTMNLTLSGYKRCHNEKEVIEKTGYDPEADLENPASSVFCSHGAGFVVPWQEVNDYRHIKD